MTAHWFGAVPAVVIGGVGTLLVTAAAALFFPALRGADRLTAESLRAAETEFAEAEPVN